MCPTTIIRQISSSAATTRAIRINRRSAARGNTAVAASVVCTSPAENFGPPSSRIPISDPRRGSSPNSFVVKDGRRSFYRAVNGIFAKLNAHA